MSILWELPRTERGALPLPRNWLLQLRNAGASRRRGGVFNAMEDRAGL